MRVKGRPVFQFACRQVPFNLLYAATNLDGNPDFVALCAAYGLLAKRAESNRQAVEIAKEMLEHKGPFVLVCRVDPDTPTI